MVPVNVIYSAPDEAAAKLVCDLLEAHDIPCRMNGTSLVALRGALPMADATVTVEVLNSDDVERARALVIEFERAATSSDVWTCPACHEENPSNFDSCWKCSQAKSDEPVLQAPSPPEQASTAALANAAVATPPRPAVPIRSLDMLLVILLGCAGSAGFAYWSSYTEWFVPLTWIKFWTLQNLVSVVAFSVCFLLIDRRGIQLREAWGHSRHWLGDFITGILLGGALYGLRIATYLILRSFDLDLTDPGHLGHVRGTSSWLTWVMLVASLFGAAAVARLLVYGVVLAWLRKWLRSSVLAGFAVTILLVLTWKLDGGPVAQALLWVEELGFVGAFLVSRRVWPIAVAATVAHLLPVVLASSR
jgi:hypothetical protein